MYIAGEHDGWNSSRWAISDAGGVVGPGNWIDSGTQCVFVQNQCGFVARDALGEELDRQGLGILSDETCVER